MRLLLLGALYLVLGITAEARLEFKCVFVDSVGSGLNSKEHEWMKLWIEEACDEMGDWVEQDAELEVHFVAAEACDPGVLALASAAVEVTTKKGGLLGLNYVVPNAIAHGILGEEGSSQYIGQICIYACRELGGFGEQRFKAMIKHELTHLLGMGSWAVSSHCFYGIVKQYSLYDTFVKTAHSEGLVKKGFLGDYFDVGNFNCGDWLGFEGPKVKEVFGGMHMLYSSCHRTDVGSSYVHVPMDNSCLALMKPKLNPVQRQRWSEIDAAIMQDLGWKVTQEALEPCYLAFYVDRKQKVCPGELPIDVKIQGLIDTINPFFKENEPGLEYLGVVKAVAVDSVKCQLLLAGQAILEIAPGQTTPLTETVCYTDDSGKCWQVALKVERSGANDSNYIVRYSVTEAEDIVEEESFFNGLFSCAMKWYESEDDSSKKSEVLEYWSILYTQCEHCNLKVGYAFDSSNDNGMPLLSEGYPSNTYFWGGAMKKIDFVEAATGRLILRKKAIYYNESSTFVDEETGDVYDLSLCTHKMKSNNEHRLTIEIKKR